MRFAIGLMLLACFLHSSSALAQGLTRAERPELKIGDTWGYQELDVRTGEKRRGGTQVLEALSEDKIVVRLEAVDPKGRAISGSNSYTRDWNLTEVKRGDTVTFTAQPAWPYYQFPLEVGKQWEAKFGTTSRGSVGERNVRWQWKVRVEGVESVTVPAGTFEAFKLRYEGYFDATMGAGRWNGTRTETLWYAPAVKRHVKTEYEQRTTTGRGEFYDHVRLELMTFKAAP